MGAIGLLARAQLRQHRRSSVAVAALVGLAAAVVLMAVAGARRVDDALASFVRLDRGADAYAVFVPSALGGDASADLQPEAQTIAAVPGVVSTDRFSNVVVAATDATAPEGPRRLLGWIGIDPGGIDALARPHVIEGRMPDPHAANEMAIDEELARDAHLGVGSTYDIAVYSMDQIDQLGESGVPPGGLAVEALIVGVVRRPSDLRDLERPANLAGLYVSHYDFYATAAFWVAADGDVAGYNPTVGIQLAERADQEATLEAVTSALGGSALVLTSEEFRDGEGTFKGVSRSVALQAHALQLFALVAALAGLFIVGQTIGRQIRLEGAERTTLQALGLTSGSLRAGAGLRAAPIAIGGAILGVVGSIALSPLTPLPGTVPRRAELDPGFHVDLVVLGWGALATASLVVAAALLPSAGGWAGAGEPTRRRPRVAPRLATAGFSVPAVIGVRFALEPGRGRSAVPVRTALASAAAAVAGALAATVVVATLDGVHDTPRRYGVTWDLSAGGMTDPDEAAEKADEVAAIEQLDAFSGLVGTSLVVDGHDVTTLFVRDERGHVGPLITEGRAPGEGEIALGGLSMEALGVSVGDEVAVEDPMGTVGPQPMTVVGRAVLNAAGIDASVAPGVGALMDWSAIEQLNPEMAPFLAPQSFLIRFDAGAPTAAATDAVRQIFPSSTTPPLEPADLTNLRDVAPLVAALGAAVAALGLGAVTHALLCAVRRRAGEVAILKSIGFVRADARRAIVWQAWTFSVLALAVGVPSGTVAGRAIWSVTAGRLGIVNHPVVPPVAGGVGALGFVALMLFAALIPARQASRIPCAALLRGD